MDILPSDTGHLSHWLIHYGSFVLFILLSLGIIALPIPEETLMVIAGVLMHKGKLNIPLTIFFAYAGAMCGISVSYIIGRTAGKFLLGRYGSWVGITPQKMEKAHNWFERMGKWLLVVGYFIPGVRHLTGFSAGSTYMKYSHFALYAYSGALLWVSFFLTMGYFVGTYFLTLYERLENADLIIATLFLLALGALTYIIFWRIRRGKKR